ncbi:MAG: hypothetical protein ACFB20_13160 [Opitutales bacterium]
MNRSKDVVYKLPSKFIGVVLVKEDLSSNIEPEIIDSITYITVPESGVVAVKDVSFLNEWHTPSGSYPDGSSIPGAKLPEYSYPITLTNLGYLGSMGHFRFVGTREQYEIVSAIELHDIKVGRWSDDDFRRVQNSSTAEP